MSQKSGDISVVRAPNSWSKGTGFESRQNFLLQGQLSVLAIVSVSAVARKRSRSFCQKRGWQITAKHTGTPLRILLKMKWLCKLVHGCALYIELTPRRKQQFYVAPAMQKANSAVSTPLKWIFIKRAIMQQPNSAVSTPLKWIFIKRAIKGDSHSQSHAPWTQWVCSRAENSAM